MVEPNAEKGKGGTVKCGHREITGYSFPDGDSAGVWSCLNCRIRFYPHDDAGRALDDQTRDLLEAKDKRIAELERELAWAVRTLRRLNIVSEERYAELVELVPAGWVDDSEKGSQQTYDELEAEVRLLNKALKEVQMCHDDLRWCNKDDLCHIKAEGIGLALGDIEGVLSGR